MKLRKLIFLCSVFFITLAIVSCNPQPRVSKNEEETQNSVEKIRSRGKLIVGTGGRLPGMSYLDVFTDRLSGFEPDIARAIAKKILGDENLIDFVITIPDNRIPFLVEETVDIVIENMTITTDRKKFVDFSQPYYIAGQSLLVKKGSSIHSIYDLKGKTVAVTKSTTYQNNIQRLVPGAKIIVFDDIIDALDGLRSGDVDAISNDHIILSILKFSASDPQNYELVGGLFSQEPWGIAIAKGQPELLNIINETLAELKKSGGWTKLYDKDLKPITGLTPLPPP